MALNDVIFTQKLKAIFDAMDAAASGIPKNNQWYAEQLAKAIDDQIKTAEVQPGIDVSGGTITGATAASVPVTGGTLTGSKTVSKGVIL